MRWGDVPGQLPALELRQVLTDRIEFVDGGARAKQQIGQMSHVIESDAIYGECQERRAATGEQADDQIILSQV
jgi:hypothetical protein